MVSASTVKNMLLYGLAYLLWFVCIIVSIVALFQILSTINVFWVTFGGDRYSLGLVNQACLLLGGLITFAYVILLENRYRESIARQVEKTSSLAQSRLLQKLTDWKLDVLLKQFVITTAIPIAVVVVSLLALEIALRILAR